MPGVSADAARHGTERRRKNVEKQSMILKDGTYEVEDLFYADSGFTIKVEGGEIEFFEGAGTANRLKLAVTDPFSHLLQSDKVISVPFGFTSKRCEFDKSLVKTILSARTDCELTRRVSGMLKVLTGCSLFESTFIMEYLSEGGLRYTDQSGGASVRKCLRGVKPDQVIVTLCRIILKNPDYSSFRRSIVEKMEHGDPEDIRLHYKLQSELQAPLSLKPSWEWTKADSEECLAILASNPFFRERLYIRPGII